MTILCKRIKLAWMHNNTTRTTTTTTTTVSHTERCQVVFSRTLALEPLIHVTRHWKSKNMFHLGVVGHRPFYFCYKVLSGHHPERSDAWIERTAGRWVWRQRNLSPQAKSPCNFLASKTKKWSLKSFGLYMLCVDSTHTSVVSCVSLFVVVPVLENPFAHAVTIFLFTETEVEHSLFQTETEKNQRDQW